MLRRPGLPLPLKVVSLMMLTAAGGAVPLFTNEVAVADFGKTGGASLINDGMARAGEEAVAFSLCARFSLKILGGSSHLLRGTVIYLGDW